MAGAKPMALRTREALEARGMEVFFAGQGGGHAWVAAFAPWGSVEGSTLASLVLLRADKASKLWQLTQEWLALTAAPLAGAA